MNAPLFNMVGCDRHGLMACHENASGIHVDPRHCTCERVGGGPLACPIDLHNPALLVAEKLQGHRPAFTPEQTDSRLEAVRMRHAEQKGLF